MESDIITTTKNTDIITERRKSDNVRSEQLLQNIMNDGNFGDLNPLLGFFLTLIFGGDLKDLLSQKADERASDMKDNSSSYGKISTRSTSQNNQSEFEFKPISKLPENVKFTSASQEEGSLNRIYKGIDDEGKEVTVIKARDTSKEGTRSWANNNPGNLRYSEWQDDYGAIGKDNDGFTIFSSIDNGLEAQKRLLESDTYKNLTLREAIYRYAPPAENDSGKYARQMSEKTGIPLDKKLSDLTDGEQNKLVTAMVTHEGWKEGKTLSSVEANKTTQSENGGLFVVKPLDSVVTSDFGPRSLGMHRGIDLRTSSFDPNGNVPLYARNDMVIANISENPGGYGHRVIGIIGEDDKGRAITVQFAHLDEQPTHIKVGDTLKAGDYLATTGTSGRTFGAHLDFEVRVGAQVVDPEKAFKTDLSDSRNGDALIKNAQQVLGRKAYSNTYNARIEPVLSKPEITTAIDNLDQKPRNKTVLASEFETAKDAPQDKPLDVDKQQPSPLIASFDGNGGVNEVLKAQEREADINLVAANNKPEIPQYIAAPPAG